MIFRTKTEDGAKRIQMRDEVIDALGDATFMSAMCSPKHERDAVLEKLRYGRDVLNALINEVEAIELPA